MASAGMPMRRFGRHDEQISALGLGGFHLGSIPTEREAIRIVQAAIDGGITFMDNAWEYHEGVSERRLGKALRGRREGVFLMTKVCTHGRNARTALRQLEESLRRLQTDHLDLWQIHECAYDNDPELHFAPGGVVEALEKARADGKVRYVGFTGHKDPDILLRMLSYGFTFDSCQLPLNGFDATFHSFEQRVLPELLRQGIAPLGMKSLGADGAAVKKKVVRAEDALRYAMSLPVAATITGIDSMRVLRQNLKVAYGFRAMSRPEMEAHRRKLASAAADGRFELYKTTAEHDGEEGRKQHGFPSTNALAR